MEASINVIKNLLIGVIWGSWKWKITNQIRYIEFSKIMTINHNGEYESNPWRIGIENY